MSEKGKKKNTKLWRIYSMFRKEIRLIVNDKFALLLIFALPAMIMFTMYGAINTGSVALVSTEFGEKSEDAMILGVVDIDPTNTFPGEDLSLNFTWYLQHSPDFIVELFEDENAALNELYYDRVDAYAVIPYGFEGNITGDIPAFVSIHISSTNIMSQAAVFGAFSRVVSDFRFDHGWIKHEVDVDTVLEFEPTGDYTAATFGVFMVVFAVFIATSATAAQAIVGDVPLNRMLLTPATKMEAILAKTLAYFAVGLIQIQFLLIMWMGMFGIVPNTDYLTLNAVLWLLSLSGSALGVVISTVVTTRLQANQSFLFLLFASMIVGTGFIDVGIIDEWFPLNLGRVMMIDTAFKGVNLFSFTDEIIRILLFSAGLILLAWGIFARRTSLA
ncbi:MAG: ABC transporter permease [Candidatus Thorarchaeota archaeon]